MTVQTLYDRLSTLFPTTLSEDWDHDGIMCLPDPAKEVTNVLCTLDVTEAAIAKAVSDGCQVILSHHPMIFSPIGAVSADESIGRKIKMLMQNEIAVFSFHTRLDAADAGLNADLARALGLTNTEPLAQMGRVGDMVKPMSLCDFLTFLCEHTLTVPAAAYVDAGKTVSRVAVVTGSGLSLFSAALAAGADTFVSGTPKHELMLEAVESGMNVICAGHFETEVAASRLLADAVMQIAPEIHTCTYDIPVIQWYHTEK